jgi:TetR/AcrR family transcriptional regulator
MQASSNIGWTGVPFDVSENSELRCARIKKTILLGTMSDTETTALLSSETVAESTPARKRPKPGERRVQILQALATMLEQPGAERITTAALAAKLGVSEAALYRHFASKAQMFEGLIEFIEQTVFSLVNQIAERESVAQVASPTEANGARQAGKIVTMLVQFAEKNPGMTRVMVGDALVFENERLQQRMNQFFDKVESTLKQCLRHGAPESDTPTVDAQVAASALTAFLAGRLQRFARSGFKRMPSEHLDACLARMLPN